MNVREIAKQYLEEHGCDGLRHPLLNCWCSLETCERCSMMMVCVPARRVDGVLVPVPDDQIGPTRQERVERKLRGALAEIEVHCCRADISLPPEILDICKAAREADEKGGE